MARCVVRPATVEDLPALLALIAAESSPVSRRHLRAPERADAAARLRYEALLADPAYRLLVAVEQPGGQVIGCTVLAPDRVGALLDEPVIVMAHTVVARAHRRHGAGRALVAAAVAHASERGHDHLVVGVAPQEREANRFFARLGFVPLATRRIAPVAALRRSLAVSEALRGEGVPHTGAARRPMVPAPRVPRPLGRGRLSGRRSA